MKQDIILVGGGGHCVSVIDIIEQEGKYNILGIVDIQQNIGKKVLNYEIIASDNDLEQIFDKCKNAVVTIGQIKNNILRVKLFHQLKEIGFHLPVIVSPLAYVSKHTTIGEGSIIMHHALINANVKVGKNCIINSKALLEHDVQVGNHCHISTASVLNGGVILEDNVFFGSNTMAREGVKIEENAVIGGGLRIMKNISKGSLVKE